METTTVTDKLLSGQVKDGRPNDLRWLIVVAIYGLSALWGVVQALNSNGLAAFLGSLLFALLTTGWCIADSRRRGRPLLSVLQMIMFFTWPVAVPIYLIASRGLRGVGYIFLHSLGMVLTMWISFLATLYCAFGTAAFSATTQ